MDDATFEVAWTDALGRLREGNARYAAGRSEHPRGDAARRMETAEQGQRPFAALVSCSDSRVPVEILFDQGLGDVATGAPLEGHLARLVTNIRHAVVRVRKEQPNASGADFVEAVARANVRQSMSDLLQGSIPLRERAAKGTFKVVGAVYDIAGGQVEWLEDA